MFIVGIQSAIVCIVTNISVFLKEKEGPSIDPRSAPAILFLQSPRVLFILQHG